jgi:hypothetical protein
VKLDGSGNMPAVDGSQLTGVSTFTSSASDPTVSTNPSGGVGTEWINTTSGEVYLCTDATAGENVWKNVGAGTGDIQPFDGRGGTVKGWIAGGGPNGSQHNRIESWSFTSDGNSTDVADTQHGNTYGMGMTASATHGYHMGGHQHNPGAQNPIIGKFAFVSTVNATDVGDLLAAAYGGGGFKSDAYGYYHGANPPSNPESNRIQKFAYATDGNTTDVANMTRGSSNLASMSSETYGYTAGANPASNVIDKHNFAAGTDSTDVGDMTVSREGTGGTFSATYGYMAAGGWPATIDVIDKVSFTTDGNATDVGNLVSPGASCGASSSKTYGYTLGGHNVSPATNVIQKHSFTTDGNATDVGDLTAVMSTQGTESSV